MSTPAVPPVPKGQFYWAIIGDANPEPVVVTGEPGQRVAYTIGCADPFLLDVPNPNIELVATSGMYSGGNWKQEPIKLQPPDKVREADHVRRREEAEKRLRRDQLHGTIHGWQRWNP